ncbi:MULTISPECIES: DUF2577 family protein [Bacillus]|uniref:DUF2577 family protein n=1 Tax=Bacillus TaxID=1386 RepID=UPI0002DD8877|nr:MULTISPECIES: DUF2577 family protein [Bacillus]
MQKRLEIEGSGAAKMIQLFRIHGHNRDITIETATVVTPLPKLSLRLSDGVVLERDDLIVAERLTKDVTLKAGDKVILIGNEITQFYYAIDKAVI